MELRHLEYFIAVAAELSFSRAAERIHVVQSALSVAVAKLEKELGVALFDRTRRQIALTATGEVFLEHAREVIHAAHRAQSSVADYRDQLTGSVTLGTLMSWGALNLPGGSCRFSAAQPVGHRASAPKPCRLGGAPGSDRRRADGPGPGVDHRAALTAHRAARIDLRTLGFRVRTQSPAGQPGTG